MKLGIFKWPLAGTVLALAAAVMYAGAHGALVVALLIGLESSVSFDNAVVNAGVLRRLSDTWRKAFVTVGIVIAVFVMRVVFPIALVVIATNLGFAAVIDEALHDQASYAEHVRAAQPVIGGFGGVFLLLVSFTFLFDPDKDTHWIAPVERLMAWAGRVRGLPVAFAAAALLAAAYAAGDTMQTLAAGVTGIVVFEVVHGISETVAAGGGRGASGFAGFLYLEMLDASFSLDGVLGAFAISTDLVLIALGLGVGALFVRSLTVEMVRSHTLRQYVYLKHGAHWAIGVLGVILFVSITAEVPEWLTGLIGGGLILAAFLSSRGVRKRAV